MVSILKIKASAWSALLFLFFWSGVGSAFSRGLPACEGIVNFGKVSEGLYRGAQPDVDGMENLKRLGVKTIVNLRMGDDAWADEQAQASSHGIIYTNVPLRGAGRPTDEQIRTVLSLIGSLPGPVFIHCRHGCDRTGTIVACYRIEHDGWSVAKAMAEANRYGLSWFERGMRRFVAKFARSHSEQVALN